MSIAGKLAKLRKAKLAKESRERELKDIRRHGLPKLPSDIAEWDKLDQMVKQAETAHESLAHPIIQDDRPGYVGKHQMYADVHKMYVVVSACKELKVKMDQAVEQGADVELAKHKIQWADLWAAVRGLWKQPWYRKASQNFNDHGHVLGKPGVELMELEADTQSKPKRKVKGRVRVQDGDSE